MFETVRVEADTVGVASHDVCEKGTNVIIMWMLPCRSLTGM